MCSKNEQTNPVLLKIWATQTYGREMKKPSIFPMLPKNLSIPQLRKEIRRRLKISEQLGLIKKPKK